MIKIKTGKRKSASPPLPPKNPIRPSERKKEPIVRRRVTGRAPVGAASLIDVNPTKSKTRLVIGIPTTGMIRYEWAIARWGQIIPVNWSNAEIAQAYAQVGPIGYLVADARNIIAYRFLEDKDSEWLLFIDHDTIIPPDTYVRMNEYIRKGKEPVVGGLYYAKGDPPPPLVFRGRGNSYYDDWKRGDIVRVDAVPMGCTLLHRSLIEATAEISEDYMVPGLNKPIKKIFETPRRIWYDAESRQYLKDTGTEDIFWCDKILDNKILAKAGWKKHAKMKYPFIIDTNIFCTHIDLQTGKTYPSAEYIKRFLPEPKKK